jgi:glycosyltransferase-like protein
MYDRQQTRGVEVDTEPPVALVTYSTRPRGGVVHTLALAEALREQGCRVHIVTLGDPRTGFFRPTTVPHTVIPAPPNTGSLERKVFASVDRLAEALAGLDGFDVLHTQDCISARAAARVRDAGAPVQVVRTVHHVDDFTTDALIHCQRQAILEPDHLIVVSEQWRKILRHDYGVSAFLVHNGVDADRFGPIPDAERARLRAQVGAQGRFLLLSVGGVEPRKGTAYLFEALAELKRTVRPSPVLAVIGGHSFQDYAAYRTAALDSLPGLGLTLGTDVVLLGTVPDEDLPRWYRAADGFAFPSTKEGWGLAVLEAMSADLPVVASDLPVFQEYLEHGVSALLPSAGDSAELAAALGRVIRNERLRDTLRAHAGPVVRRFTWAGAASRHRTLYRWMRRSALRAG